MDRVWTGYGPGMVKARYYLFELHIRFIIITIFYETRTSISSKKYQVCMYVRA